MRPALLSVILVSLACGRDNPEWALLDTSANTTVVLVPSGTWTLRTNGLLTNTCGVATPARANAEWTTLALSPEMVNLYTAQRRMVVLVRKSDQVYEGEISALVSPFPQCTIRERLGYLVRMQAADRADGVLSERFELAAGRCDGVLPLPCELAQHFEMVLK
jgi:hypothetical protein